MVLSLGIYN